MEEVFHAENSYNKAINDNSINDKSRWLNRIGDSRQAAAQDGTGKENGMITSEGWDLPAKSGVVLDRCWANVKE